MNDFPSQSIGPQKPGQGIRVLVLFGGVPLLGQERANLGVFEALKPLGVDTLFITHRELGYLHMEGALTARGFAWKQLSFQSLGRGGSPQQLMKMAIGMLRSSWQLLGIVRAYRPTHFHVCNPSHFLSFLPALLLLRQPLIYRLGDEPQQHHVLYRLLWKIIIRRTSHFVCNSRFMHRRLSAMGAPSNKLSICYTQPQPRPNVRAFAPPSCSAQHDSNIRLVFAGQLTAHKGIDLLVEAVIELAPDHPTLQLWIAGDYSWNGELAELLKRRVASAGLNKRIVFLGYVDDIAGLFAHCHLHVVPSVWEEPLASVVLEAKAAAIPTVVFPAGGLPEVIEDGIDGWICSARTGTALRETLAKAIAEPTRLQILGGNARTSLKRFGSEDFAARWLSRFQPLCGVSS